MKKISTGLLSFGMSGRVFHAPFITLHPGFQLAGSWERSKKVIGDHYPGVRSYPTLEDLLGDAEIDLVVVNTPTYSHFEYAKKALQAGKHTIVEKAFTTTLAEAEELRDLAAVQKKKLSVFQNRRWDSDFRTVQHVLKSGWLGPVVETIISYDRFGAALSPKAHKETPGPGAGIVKDLSPHLIDQALVLYGMPNSVFADIRVTRPLSRVPDYFEILLYYPSHRVRLRSGYFVREPIPSYVVYGMNGSFLKPRADVQEVRLQAGEKPVADGWKEPEAEQGLLHTEMEGQVVRKRIETLPGNYLLYYDAVHRAITLDQPMPVTAADGVNVMRIIDAAERSSRDRQVVDL